MKYVTVSNINSNYSYSKKMRSFDSVSHTHKHTQTHMHASMHTRIYACIHARTLSTLIFFLHLFEICAIFQSKLYTAKMPLH